MATVIPKVAIDSNILYSAITSPGGSARRLLALAEEEKIRLGVSKFCRYELEPVFRDVIGEGWEKYFKELTNWLDIHAEEIVKPRGSVLNKYRDYVKDPEDLYIIAPAIEWGAEYFVTRNFDDYDREKVNSHLLMVSVRQFLEIFHAA
jgi:predicted nucleic acid-binding protein